ncbi:MAG TPA: hypothetical protein VKY82_08785 [Flavobacterium sp.]|nr:hypothetical protein [Flavobacterium sp.]
MKKTVLTTAFLLGVFSIQAQEFFSEKRPVQTETEFTRRVNDISYDIDVIIKTNKDKLKEALNEIERQVENNELTKEEADKLRNEKAEFYAQKIEEETALQESRIKKLINNKIEDNINFSTDMSAYQKQLIEKKVLFVAEYIFGHSIMLIDNKFNNDYYKSSALTSFGVSLGAKTRIGEETSRIFWKSGLEINLHVIQVKNNKTIDDVDNQTVLIEMPFKLDKSTLTFSDIRWSNYLEYDFSKKKHDEFGNPIIKSHQSFYVGIGGYIGIAPNTSKTLTYIKDGEKYRESTWSRFNSERFMYGVGAYVGYKAFSIRASYNLNNTFKKSFADQNMFNVSLVLSLI